MHLSLSGGRGAEKDKCCAWLYAPQAAVVQEWAGIPMGRNGAPGNDALQTNVHG